MIKKHQKRETEWQQWLRLGHLSPANQLQHVSIAGVFAPIFQSDAEFQLFLSAFPEEDIEMRGEMILTRE